MIFQTVNFYVENPNTGTDTVCRVRNLIYKVRRMHGHLRALFRERGPGKGDYLSLLCSSGVRRGASFHQTWLLDELRKTEVFTWYHPHVPGKRWHLGRRAPLLTGR